MTRLRQSIPDAPGHLGPVAREWWLDIVKAFELEPHHIAVLTRGAEMLDRLVQAREAVDADGCFVPDRFKQLKPHPGLAVQKDCTTLFLRATRELGLDYSEVPDSRPPRLTGSKR